jgi:hypothetical protein
MTVDAPIVDPRDAAAFRGDLATELKKRVPEWQGDGQDQASTALIAVVARFCEIVAQRLNQVPDKNFLAFLDLLGVSLLPPQPARVPLTFTLAANSPVDAVVPAGTQAAAPPGAGQKDPVVFETERELTVVAATLQSLFAANGAADLIADHSILLTSVVDEGVAVFGADRPNEHIVYIGHAYLALDNLRTVRLDVQGQQFESGSVINLLAPALLSWEAWDGSAWHEMTQGLLSLPDSVSGTYVFPRAAGLQPSAARAIGGMTSSWMRARVRVPISSGSIVPIEGASSSTAMLPTYQSVAVSATVGRDHAQPDAVFTNSQAADGVRPFFPFGEKPKLGDALYIGCREAFGLPGASVTLELPVANPASMSPEGASIPPVGAHDIELSWEAWNGVQWIELGHSTAAVSEDGTFNDRTLAFTSATDPRVTLQVPPEDAAGRKLMPTTINGVTSYWIRARIVAGNYGVEAHFVDDAKVPGGQRLVPASFAPPLLEHLDVSYEANVPPRPADLVAFNNFQYENIGARLAAGSPALPFRALPEQPPSLYIAFTLPPVRGSFPNRPVSLYHGLTSPVFGRSSGPLQPRASVLKATPGATPTDVVHLFTLTHTGTQSATYQFQVLGGVWDWSLSFTKKTLAPGESISVSVTVSVPPAAQIPSGTLNDLGVLLASANGRAYSAAFETRIGAVPTRQRAVRWEYWNGASWTQLPVVDATDELTQSGVVEFLGPSDFALASNFGVSGYWLRVLFDPGEGDPESPLVRTLLPNTTLAAQTATLLDELLGSSDATAGLRFRTARAPVMPAPQLEVREPAPLPPDEIKALQTALGLSNVVRASDNANEVWVRWIEVPDLYASGPTDRHYVLDHVSGEARFGDGVQGRIPPRGTGNVRMARYQTGGGTAGNVAAGAIVQLKRTVAYIDKVTNRESATGGFGAESGADLRARAPRALRHGGRSVAAEDYEDLARLASPEVARAKCVPLSLLKDKPLGSDPIPGAASVIILPGSAGAKPLPSAELLARVEAFLLARRAVNAQIQVVGPLYVRVDVDVEVALTRIEGASQVEDAIRAGLAAFLHPLTGGRDGTGWDFGREPHVSDLHAVVAVPGVDHVERLSFTQAEDLPGVAARGRFLIYSGQHRIKLTFQGAR